MKISKLLPVSMALLFLLTSAIPAGRKSKKLSFLEPKANAEQIVFSGTGVSTSGPFGFWIWSEDQDASNPYHGEASGSIYLYALGLTKHVEGNVDEVSPGVYTISAWSRDGTIVATLTNATPVVSGPKNTVNVTFSSPSGVSGVSRNAVVVITGP